MIRPNRRVSNQICIAQGCKISLTYILRLLHGWLIWTHIQMQLFLDANKEQARDDATYVARTLLSWNRVVSETHPSRVLGTRIVCIFKDLSLVHVSYPFSCCRVRAIQDAALQMLLLKCFEMKIKLEVVTARFRSKEDIEHGQKERRAPEISWQRSEQHIELLGVML